MKKPGLLALLFLILTAVACNRDHGDENLDGCEAADLDHSGRVDGYDLVLATQSCNQEKTVALVQRCFGAQVGGVRDPWPF